jgi:hypothetical protein
MEANMRRAISAFLLAWAVSTGLTFAQDDDDDDNAPEAVEEEPAEPASSSDGFSVNTQLLMGQAWLQDQWRPIDEPMTFGFEADFGPKTSIVHVALGFNIGWDSEDVATPVLGEIGDVGVGLAEFSAGFLIHPLKKGQVRPYIGAGIVRTFAGFGTDWDFWTDGDTDSTFGVYGNAGIFFKVGSVFNFGFDGRIVRGTEIDIAGIETDVDYEQASLLIGFSWGN